MKQETRITPESVPPKFYSQHLKPYEFMLKDAKDKCVLEVGCGDGYGSAFLAEVAHEVIGIDYDKDVIQQAKIKYEIPNLKFMNTDATNLSFMDNSFDLICSFQVIEHIPEDKSLDYLWEIKRVLKNNGKVYISTLNLDHVKKSPVRYQKQPAHCKEFNLQEFYRLLSKIFSQVKIYGLHITFKHSIYQRLKKIGIFNLLPYRLNPVKRFYNSISTSDFVVTSNRLKEAMDFIAICQK